MKKIMTSPFFALGAFVLAAILLLTAGIGGASAALNDTSDTYELDIATQNIGVHVNENGVEAADEELTLAGIPDDPREIKLDTDYDEVLTVTNEGDIEEYVRVIVYQYWTYNWVDSDGFTHVRKLTGTDTLDPSLIELNFVEGNGWTIYSQSEERTIMNYAEPIAYGETTTPFVDGISISGDLADFITTTTETSTAEDGSFVTTTTTVFELGDEFDLSTGWVNLVVEVETDGVQTHNAEDAMNSAWGYNIF